MVGGAREAMNWAAPSLPVVLNALLVEALSRGGRQPSVSAYGDSTFRVPGQTQPPTPRLPKNSGNITGTRGAPFTGPKTSAYTHPSAQRMGRFRPLSGPELLGLRTGPHASVSLGLGRAKQTGDPQPCWPWTGVWDLGLTGIGVVAGVTSDSRVQTGEWVLRE